LDITVFIILINFNVVISIMLIVMDKLWLNNWAES